jgi:hypothetical protein
MKIHIKTLRRLIREAYREAYTGPLTLDAIPQDLFDVESPDMSKLSPHEAFELMSDIRNNQVTLLQSIQRRAMRNHDPKPGELGTIKKWGKGTLDSNNDPTPELAEFLKKASLVEKEYLRRNKEYDKALKRKGDAEHAALSPEEKAEKKRSHDELMSVYGGPENYRSGRGLGT